MSDPISIAIADGMADVLLTRVDKMNVHDPAISMRWPKLAIGSARSGAAGRRCAGGINACRSSSVRGTRSEAAL
jgi:hypothetical protein